MYYEEDYGYAGSDDTSLDLNANTPNMKKNDSKYEKYSIKVSITKNGRQARKNVNIVNYGSGQQGAFIRNAVTGNLYIDLVGSKAEDLYFKVVDSTGRFNRKEPIILFYDTPDQFENHHYTTVHNSVKEKWYEKCLDSRKKQHV